MNAGSKAFCLFTGVALLGVSALAVTANWAIEEKQELAKKEISYCTRKSSGYSFEIHNDYNFGSIAIDSEGRTQQMTADVKCSSNKSGSTL